MILREDLEKREYRILSPLAAKSAESKGREHEEAKCEFRTDFQRDRDRIVHSKSFRRLMHKTQVFLAPEGDHFRTRLTHTLEVSQIARTIARGLGLNEDLDKVKNIIFSLYNYYFQKPEFLPEEGQGMILKYGVNEVVKDYIAGMTDRFAMNLYDDLFIPKGWK